LRLAEGFRDDRRHTGANMSTVGVYIAMKKVHFFLPTFLVFRVSAVALKGFQKPKKIAAHKHSNHPDAGLSWIA
jgi:hypothetical protein